MRIKLISLNVWIGGILMDQILEFLKFENADIVFLQEVFDGHDEALDKNYRTMDVLREIGMYSYTSFAPAFIESVDEQKIVQGQAILSKFPLKENETVFYDQPFGDRRDGREWYAYTPRNLQRVIAHIGGRLVHLYNTQGIWGEDGNDSPRRTKMVRTILSSIEKDDTVILGGDLNLLPTTKAVKEIENTLESVFKTSLKTSFNLSRKNIIKDPGYATSAVDMLFVSRDIKIISARCPEVDISDHLPCIAELQLPPI